eukprot:5796840-Amphidinium_carterae.1
MHLFGDVSNVRKPARACVKLLLITSHRRHGYQGPPRPTKFLSVPRTTVVTCLLYTSDAADDTPC